MRSAAQSKASPARPRTVADRDWIFARRAGEKFVDALQRPRARPVGRTCKFSSTVRLPKIRGPLEHSRRQARRHETAAMRGVLPRSSLDALARWRQTHEAAQCRRLAGTVTAEQRRRLCPCASFEADTMQNMVLAVIGVEPFDRKCAVMPLDPDRLLAPPRSRRSLSACLRQAIAPSSTVMRPARWKTTRISCSISTIVSLPSLCRRRISCAMSYVSWSPIPAVGSSSSSSRGVNASAIMISVAR